MGDGLVCPASAAEQLLYEIHDPGAYHVPDVACDWTNVHIEQVNQDTVRVTGARGQPPTDTYKCICTYPNGVKFTSQGTVVGHDARSKGQRIGHSLMTRWKNMVIGNGKPDFSDSRVEVFGGDFECSFRISVKHSNRKVLEPSVRECATATVSMAQGGMVMPGNITPVISVFMLLKKKSEVESFIDTGSGPVKSEVKSDGGFVD